jgi:hypothetical protein
MVPVLWSQINSSVFTHVGAHFIKKTSSNNYVITDIVKLSSLDSVPTFCFKFYDTSIHAIIPKNDNDFEKSIDLLEIHLLNVIK